MMLCDGNSIEADKIMNSPVRMYEDKLNWFADTHKPEKKRNDPLPGKKVKLV